MRLQPPVNGLTISLYGLILLYFAVTQSWKCVGKRSQCIPPPLFGNHCHNLIELHHPSSYHSPPPYILSSIQKLIKNILYILTNVTPAHGHVYLLSLSNYPLFASLNCSIFSCLSHRLCLFYLWTESEGLSPAESCGSLEKTMGIGIISVVHNLSWRGSFPCKTPPLWFSCSCV